MKTLCVLLLLAVLGRSLSEGKNVSVCELTTQLRSAGANYTQLNASDPNVLAQIVCYADILSNLSTSTQTNETQVIRDGEKGDDSGENQSGGHRGEKPEGKGAKSGPVSRCHSRSPKGSDHGQNHHGSGSAQPICTLYGIFQLSSCQACHNGVTPSENICNLNCSELLDDDISNDVVCLFTVMFSKTCSMWQELEESLGKNQINQSGQCSNVSAYMCK